MDRQRCQHSRIVERRGFTLVEMMVLIGILGLLAALAVPSFQSYNRANVLDTTADMLAADVNLARATAVMQGRRLELKARATGYTIEYQDSGDLLRDRTYKGQVQLQHDIDIVFHPRGSATPTATMTLVEGSMQINLTVMPTGMVEVCR